LDRAPGDLSGACHRHTRCRELSLRREAWPHQVESGESAPSPVAAGRPGGTHGSDPWCPGAHCAVGVDRHPDQLGARPLRDRRPSSTFRRGRGGPSPTRVPWPHLREPAPALAIRPQISSWLGQLLRAEVIPPVHRGCAVAARSPWISGKRRRPAWEELEPGRMVRCHRARELDLAGVPDAPVNGTALPQV
jgi:hypothetical protein